MTKTRVLHVITDPDRRGAQIFAGDLAAALMAHGLYSKVVALAPGGHGPQLPVSVLGRRRLGPRTLWALRRRMRDADVVVAHGSSTLPATVVAGAGTGTRLIYRNISDPAYWMGTAFRKLRVRRLLARVDRVVCLWPGGADFLRGQLSVPEGRIAVIPNGVETGAFVPPSDDQRDAARRRFGLTTTEPVVLYLAAFQPEKHPELAVETVAQLSSATQLLMVGDGPRRAQVEAQAASLSLGRVCFTGSIDDPQSAYWAADVIVLPSRGEGLPAALIEAALSGVPAVSSDSGGCADIVADTGRVVRSDRAAEYARAVEEVLADRRALGRAARTRCLERYDMVRVTAAWADVIKALAANAAPSVRSTRA